MLMSLLVLRVLYLFFDSIAHGLHLATRVLKFNDGMSAQMLGLSVDGPDDDGGEFVGVNARNGSAMASKRPTHV